MTVGFNRPMNDKELKYNQKWYQSKLKEYKEFQEWVKKNSAEIKKLNDENSIREAKMIKKQINSLQKQLKKSRDLASEVNK